MSYFPDYRHPRNEEKLSKEDRAFLNGYRCAMEDARSFFFSDCITDEDGEDIDIDDYDLQKLAKAFDELIDSYEVEALCYLFDGADYLPEDVVLIDMNEPIFRKTKGTKSKEDIYDE